VNDWSDVSLDELVTMTSGKPIKPGSAGPIVAFGSNGIIGGAPEPRHKRGLIVGRVGAYCGSVAVSHAPFWASDNTIVLTPRKDSDLNYLYYLLLNADLNRHAGGAAQPLITQTTLKALTYRVPDESIRIKVGRVLRTFDDLIENNRRRIALLEQMAEAIYREWFVHFRYPGHEGDEMVDSPLGSIPAGWEPRPFSALATFLNGFAFKPAHWHDSGLPIVKIKELKQGVMPSTPRYHGDDIATRYRVERGDLLFSWSAFLEAYLWAGEPALLNQHLFKVAPSPGVAQTWLYLALRDRMVEFRSRSQGTTMKHIKRGALDEVFVATPSARVMSAFDVKLRPVIGAVLALSAALHPLEALRDLLLPNLVTGAIDVSRVDLDGLLEESAA